MAKRLTEPQQRLLTQIRESSSDVLFVGNSSRQYRTARALERRGLIWRTQNWATGSWDWYELVPDQECDTT